METIKVTVTLPCTDTKIHSFKDQLAPYCEDVIFVSSTAGIEIATFVLTAGEFIIAAASIPFLLQYIENNKVTLRFNGVTMKDPPKKIIKTIAKNPDVREELNKAVEKQNVEMEGNAKRILELKKSLNALLDEGDE